MASSSAGNFIPTTQVWDVSAIRNIDVTKPEFKELLVRMYQNLNTMTLTLNNKESSFYDVQETVKGQSFFASQATSNTTSPRPEGRQVFNKVINFGALPNTATKTIAHDIDIKRGFIFTRIYGTSTMQATTTPSNFSAIPLPYSTPVLADNIALYVDATTVGVTTGADWSAWTTTYIVLEYLKA
ncbi:hypothetical protein M0R72_16310 [Candidatus Pacearchaeota archaeon]|jgi:hypothetical protein|nr:hypothetical protein [Candidatus Pacearchaeota archaeon]